MKSPKRNPLDRNKAPDRRGHRVTKSDKVASWDAATLEAKNLMQRTRRLMEALKKLISYFRIRKRTADHRTKRG
jgi:hypothetical protein